MPRLIEVSDARVGPSTQTLSVGDVLLFRAAGGHVRSGDNVIELVGIFVQAVVGAEGTILMPMGPPNTVLFRARKPGHARIDVVTGDPFHAPEATVLRITVESGTGSALESPQQVMARVKRTAQRKRRTMPTAPLSRRARRINST